MKLHVVQNGNYFLFDICILAFVMILEKPFGLHSLYTTISGFLPLQA